MRAASLRVRHLTIDRSRADAAKRIVPASLSSEEPVRRGSELEVLRHDAESIDLTRARDGLPLLFCHDRTAPIGVVENVRLEGRRLVGDLRFGNSARASEVWADVTDGVLRNVSITYSVDGSEPIDGGYAVTRWALYEASVVSIPADPTVGIGREADPLIPSGGSNMPQTVTREQIDAEIRQTAARHGLPREFADALVQRGLTEQLARREILNELVRLDEASFGHVNVNPGSGLYSPNVYRGNGGTDTVERQVEQMADALAARIGGPALKGDNQYRHARVTDMARDILEMRGLRTTGLSPSDLIERAGMHTSSDFSNLLTGTGNRVLRQAYSAYQGGIKRAFKSSTAKDFRAKQRLALGEAPALKKVNEHGEFTSGTMAEAKESYSLATYGRIFAISRQALVNDDLDAFGDMTMKFARAAIEFENQFLVDLITGNPTMSDSVALFHATHGNLLTSASSVLQQSALSDGRKSMRLQKGLDGATPIDTTPRFLIVPAALETTGEQLLANLQPQQVSNVNPFSGKLELIVDPRLDAKSATAWYLAASPDTIDTVEYSYLEGEEGPQLFTEDGFDIDGMRVKVRMDFGAGVQDWRGLLKSNGA